MAVRSQSWPAGGTAILLAAGEGDLTRRVELVSGDEVGDMAAAVPEPATWALWAAGVGLLLGMLISRR